MQCTGFSLVGLLPPLQLVWKHRNHLTHFQALFYPHCLLSLGHLINTCGFKYSSSLIIPKFISPAHTLGSRLVYLTATFTRGALVSVSHNSTEVLIHPSTSVCFPPPHVRIYRNPGFLHFSPLTTSNSLLSLITSISNNPE